MATQLSLFPGEKVPKQVYEFLIVINLPDAINDFVETLKDKFYEEFGYFPSRGSKPHITISKFPFLEKQPDAIISYLQRSLQRMPPFRLEVNGFSSFPNSRVIYLNVVESAELHQLKVPFNYIRDGFTPKKYFHVFTNNPHITIARGLQPDIFGKAEKDYLSRTYKNSCMVDKLKVLRRENFGNGKYSKYEHIDDLMLGGRT